jgi:hypothetical protein
MDVAESVPCRYVAAVVAAGLARCRGYILGRVVDGPRRDYLTATPCSPRRAQVSLLMRLLQMAGRTYGDDAADIQVDIRGLALPHRRHDHPLRVYVDGQAPRHQAPTRSG